MSDTFKQSASCLCGAVTLHVEAGNAHAHACHCDTCRHWGGGPYMSIECGSAVSFDGNDQVAVYNSSDWAERGFCRQCGTHLFYRLKANQHHYVPAGLFDDQPLTFDSQVFIDEKPDYYSFANPTTNLTGAELFAQLGAEQD